MTKRKDKPKVGSEAWMRSKLERHYRPQGKPRTLCGLTVTKSINCTDSRSTAALTVTCDECRRKLPPLPQPTDTVTPVLPARGPCFLCEKGDLDPAQHYCHGCHKLICGTCDKGGAPWGSHRPKDHKLEMNDDE